jgi:hypothetical protein
MLCGINDWGSQLNRNQYRARLAHVSEEALTPIFQNRMCYRRSALVQWFNKVRLYADADANVAQDPQGNWIAGPRVKRQQLLKEHPISEVPSAKLVEALAVYQANLKEVIATCRHLRVRPLLLTQPTLWCKDLPEDLQKLLFCHNGHEAYTVDVLAEMMDAYNKALIDVCREEGVDYIDLAAMLPKDTSVFYDDAHFNITGCEKIATILCDFFAARLGR